MNQPKMPKIHSLGIMLFFVFATFLGFQTSPGVFHGFKVGADTKLADNNQIEGQFYKLAQESPELKFITIGLSTMRKRIIVAENTSIKNIAGFGAYRDVAKKIGEAQTVPVEEAKKSVREDKIKSDLKKSFDRFDFAINHGKGLINYTNEDGNFAWAESFLLEAYVIMYEVTKDKKYLEKFIAQADWIYDNTDKSRGIKDYKGRIRTGWSTAIWSKNKEPMLHMVHTGIIVFPFTRFILAVKNATDLNGYVDKVERYTRLAEEAVAEFDGQWHLDLKTNEGYYLWEGDEPITASYSIPDAFNSHLALGKVIIMLYKITGKKSYLEKATGLARYFKNRVILMPNGSSRGFYIWPYRHDLKSVNVLEDISHGAICINFAFEAYKAGIVFDNNDMLAFSRTLINSARKQPKGFSKFVDGTGLDEMMKSEYYDLAWEWNYSDTSGGWLDLAAVDARVYKVIYDYLAERINGKENVHPRILLGIAKLLLYAR